ncbi:uncharacterized protein MYCGRDRAFT_85339 [Zymoseptoria tritici IPO323]|uniref:NUDE domain-containing protein n=1 Tax=Zymoseptoria tritici (strain CBS 115943 / IPO323) TaxID=336722 RepID=F9X7X9_ZYMTI|nr:uncharacterized protein MYCGRDRAFT_85339 [Zymoseptoria tritici IPO323]EGP88954.1 hypothetical protein MYCGRDRAFT_85339 [Zymoseptoria tritici IPO323]
MSSSPLRPGADLKEQLEWYKVQYAQLETDLADFQASSKELEEQLEKDVVTAEKNELKWKQQVEKLTSEVEEWKEKHKKAKAEANTAQNTLQKEITTMREQNLALQLRLRDTEVMNDDYEQQKRYTETSLEDLESKYNTAIERGVLFEETIKQSEQEREELRIETQRLRNDLSDLKVESDINVEKLRAAEEQIESLRARKPTSLAVETLRARSPASEASGMTALSPTASTPPPKSDSLSEVATPPSPPLSDTPAVAKTEQKTPSLVRKKAMIPDSRTPRPSFYGARAQPSHARGVSVTSSTSTALTDGKSMRPSGLRPPRVSRAAQDSLPRSESLYQIRGLIGRMQKIEERVHSARSKLPAPGRTPTGSPRAGSALGENIPSSVTVRRSMKRPSGSMASSGLRDEETDTSTADSSRRDSHRPDRPPSAMDRPPFAMDRPASAMSRPSSRASISGRPASRSGARTEMGNYSSATQASSNMASRPRSSMTGAYGTIPRGHKTTASFSELHRRAAADSDDTATPNRRTTLERSGIPPPPSALPTPKREGGSPRRDGGMGPPPSRKQRVSDVGETY